MNPWKACDIRGIYPTEVSPVLLRRVGASVGSMFPPGSRFLIAGDFRESTPQLKEALAEGLISSGARILDAGQIPTPIAYFAHKRWKTDAVMIVTASHNPANYNGLKLMLGDLPPTPEDFKRIQQSTEEAAPRHAVGNLEKIDPVPCYHEWILERWQKAGALKGRKVVIDAGNGAWSKLAPAIFRSLGFDIDTLFCEINGKFPERSPDCARAASLAALRQEVKRTDAILGIAWDGDGDRVAFVDEAAEVVSTDEVSALLIQKLVPEEPGSRVVYDIKLSDTIRRLIIECGGIPIMEKSGHTFIKRRMILENGLLGCEVSGHYFFRELGGGDDGLFTAILMANLLEPGASLNYLRTTLPPIYATPDLRLPAQVLSYEAVAGRLRQHFTSAKELTIDGLRLETAEGFILTRQSVTEPVVTMRIEGVNKGSLDNLVKRSMKVFPELAEEIREQIEQTRNR